MESFKFQERKLPHLLFGTENSASNFAVEVLRYNLYSRWFSIMDEAGRRVDIAPAPVMQSMAIEGSVGYKSWSHTSFFPRKSADKHTKSYHLLGITKLKILKHLKTEKIQNGFTETLRRQRRVCCRDMYDPYGENTETWLELLEAIPLAGSCLVQISQQQAVLPRFIVHRPITVWMHSSWARFHWDEHILLYSSCTWFHWRGMWISFRLCFKPAMIVMYFDGSLDPIDLGLEKEVSHASCRNPEEGIMLSSSFAVASGMVWEFWSRIVWMLCVWFTKWIHSSGVQGILWCPCFCSLTLLCVWLAPCRADSSFLMSWGPCPSLNVKKSGTFSPCLRIVVVHRHRKAEHGVM